MDLFVYSGQHALDETNSSDDDKKKNPAIRKLVYSQYRYQGYKENCCAYFRLT